MAGDTATSVLVVDDEDILQRLMTRVLERAGFAAVAVADGDAALAALEREPGRFAAVVLDGGIPPAGAEPTLRALLAGDPGVGVVLVSGADIGRELRALLATCDGEFLAKPFSPDSLLDAVQRVSARAQGGGR